MCCIMNRQVENKKLIVLGIVLVFLVVTVGVYFFNNNVDETVPTFLSPAQPYQSHGALEARQCTSNEDCILVQTGWCQTVQSVNKKYLDVWTQEDEMNTQRAKEIRQTCKPAMSEYLDINNYQAICSDSTEGKRCVSVFKQKQETINTQTTTSEKCANYHRNENTINACATCGNGICEQYERCTSSSIFCEDENNPSTCGTTPDCGQLYCPDDCAQYAPLPQAISKGALMTYDGQYVFKEVIKTGDSCGWAVVYARTQPVEKLFTVRFCKYLIDAFSQEGNWLIVQTASGDEIRYNVVTKEERVIKDHDPDSSRAFNVYAGFPIPNVNEQELSCQNNDGCNNLTCPEHSDPHCAYFPSCGEGLCYCQAICD